MKLEYIVTHNAILKDYLLEIGLSRKFCRKVKLYGKMFINNDLAKNFFEVKTGDKITIEYEESTNNEIVDTENELNIVYEDEHILVINKKEGLSSQPSKKHYEDNVVSYVKNYFIKQNINTNVHIVNRLDFQTSGLMTIAKDGYTHYLLTKEKIITRKYLALVEGTFNEKSGKIDLPIARIEEGNILREVSDNGKQAITLYKVIRESQSQSLLDIELLTGRTHQIRVHFSYLGHPLIGDKLYGGKNEKRLYLHSYYLSFINPYTNEKIEIIDPLLNNMNYTDFWKEDI